jgi:hypothetical protein
MQRLPPVCSAMLVTDMLISQSQPPHGLSVLLSAFAADVQHCSAGHEGTQARRHRQRGQRLSDIPAILPAVRRLWCHKGGLRGAGVTRNSVTVRCRCERQMGLTLLKRT